MSGPNYINENMPGWQKGIGLVPQDVYLLDESLKANIAFSIARSLYSSPSLLVLDEATSALDNETELRISETIQSLHGSLTLIVVVHRLTTIKNCDRVLFRPSVTKDVDATTFEFSLTIHQSPTQRMSLLKGNSANHFDVLGYRATGHPNDRN